MQAADTGRVLLLQRAYDDDDPAGGRWEFPGGHLDDGEPSHVAACREWCEEVGQKLPAGRFDGSWQAGVYEGHVWRIEHEADVDLTDRDSLTNPDDPDGDQFEAVAWFDPALLAGNPALRDELAASLPVVLPALGVEPLTKATWDDHPLRRVEDKLTDFYAAKLHAALRKLVTPEAIRAAVAKYAETHQVAKEGWNPQTQPRDDHGRFVGGGDAKETKSGSLRGNADRAALDASAKSAGKGLDAVQEQALNRWTAGRGGVRAFQTGNVSSEQAQAFDSTMQDMPKVDGLVYRGVSGQGAQFQAGLNVGDHVHLGEPVSTSVDPGKAGAFGTNLYEIRSPAAAYIGPNSATPWEHEAVLAPGNYEVTGVRDTTTRLGSQEASIHVVTLSDTTTGSRSWLPDGSTGHMTVTKEMEPADHVSDEVDPDRESRFMEGAPGDVGTFRLVSSEVAKEGWNPQTQPRDDHGRFVGSGSSDTKASSGKAGGGGGSSGSYPEITASDIESGGEGRSRAVSSEQFQQLASEGHAQMAAMDAAASPPAGLDQNWNSINSTAYSACQESWGGATFDAHTGASVTGAGGNAYAMTVRPAGMSSVKVSEHASESEFRAAMDSARSQFGSELSKGGRCLGVFHNDAGGTIEIDPVLVVHDLHSVETIGAYTHAVGGAYNFADGQGYWPPHVGG